MNKAKLNLPHKPLKKSATFLDVIFVLNVKEQHGDEALSISASPFGM
jgi:hypothetical protein